MRESPAELLAAIAQQVRACTACPLHATRTQAVPGEGPATAQIAFIGEAPGRDEDRLGRPFVGQAGKLLRSTITELGWREDEVFIGNVIKCRPPDNRDPLETEIAACRHYLMAQLTLLAPKLIVTLGRFSMRLLIETNDPIGRLHGRHILRHGQLYLPCYHPSATLHNPNLRPEFRKDMLIARKLFEQLTAQPDA